MASGPSEALKGPPAARTAVPADRPDLARAAALLERTRALLASVEAEVEKLHRDTEAAEARIRDWEAFLQALLPQVERVTTDVHVEAVHAEVVEGVTTADGSVVYTVDERRAG